MEKGKVMSVRPYAGVLATFHDMPTRPMTKLGRSVATAATLRMEEVFMWVVFAAGYKVLKVVPARSPLYTRYSSCRDCQQMLLE